MAGMLFFSILIKKQKTHPVILTVPHGDDLESQEITKDNIEVSVGKVQSKNDEESCYIENGKQMKLHIGFPAG